MNSEFRIPSFELARDPVEVLLEEFSARRKRGEPASVAEYVARYPQHAAEIEELFPAAAQMEQFRAAETARRDAAARRAAPVEIPERLGDFLVRREIGRGGMGVVCEALQQSLGRPVAVKVLPRDRLARAADLDRFQREAQTAARLQHTHIVPVFGVGQQDGLHYYVMPLVPGVGLDEIIAELRDGGDAARPRDVAAAARRLTAAKFGESAASAPAAPAGDFWSSVARVGIQAGAALEHAHRLGILHCDVKPGNLLVDADGVVHVADFGLARAASAAGGDVGGTARYMAPEQLQGAADARSDVYGLGAALYELVTLRRLDPAAGPLRPRAIDPSVPRDLEAIVLRCLARDPGQRYASAGAVREDLERFLAGKPVCARPVCLLERGARWCRRNPALAAACALAGVLLVGIGVVGLAAHVRTRAAYAQTRAALERAQSTSHLALEMLDDVYLQLSPERVWIAWDSDPAGQACACMGLATGDAASSVERVATRVRASRQTAALLEGLLEFYDRLAEQGGDDRRVRLQSAIASRRVGDLRLVLGQVDRAEREYAKAVEKLNALGAQDGVEREIAVELARNGNEIGNVLSVRLRPDEARRSHQKALETLDRVAARGDGDEEYRYERARTLYFLASKGSGGPFGSTARQRSERRGDAPHAPGDWKAAIEILERLVREHSRAPDCRLMLALCYRSAEAPGGQGRQRAIRLLEELAAEFPGVADYRYELIATYAWLPVSLFPWQGPTSVTAEGERDLRKALDESERLVRQYSGVPHYGVSQAVVLAKLATVCAKTDRPAEAQALFQRAVEAQARVVGRHQELAPHQRVLLEFLRLRLAQVAIEHQSGAPAGPALAELRAMLTRCVDSLAELSRRPELAGDRLVGAALPLARATLDRLPGANGDEKEASSARQKAEKSADRKAPAVAG